MAKMTGVESVTVLALLGAGAIVTAYTLTEQDEPKLKLTSTWVCDPDAENDRRAWILKCARSLDPSKWELPDKIETMYFDKYAAAEWLAQCEQTSKDTFCMRDNAVQLTHWGARPVPCGEVRSYSALKLCEQTGAEPSEE